MRKLFSILILFVLLFNVFGYRLAISYMEKNATQKLTSSIETKNFDENNLIEIKTELNMPYVSDREYENANGETVINGVHYQYVKQKIENNVLYLLCLPNEEKIVLSETKNNIEKNNIESSSNNSKQKSPLQLLKKITQTEYTQNSLSYIIINSINISATTLPKVTNSMIYSLNAALTPEQPPEMLV